MVKKIVKRTPKCLDRIANERFQGRLDCLMRKTHEIGAFCDSEVYLVLYRRNRYYTYKSKTSPKWPPSEQQINESGTDTNRRTPADYQSLRRIELLSPSNTHTSKAGDCLTTVGSTRAKGFEKEISMSSSDQLDTDRSERFGLDVGPSFGPLLLEPETGDGTAVQQRLLSPASDRFLLSDSQTLQVLDDDTTKVQDRPRQNHLADPSSRKKQATRYAPYVLDSHQPYLCSVSSKFQDYKSEPKTVIHDDSANNFEDEEFWAGSLLNGDFSFPNLEEPIHNMARLDWAEDEGLSFTPFLEDPGIGYKALGL